MAHVKAAALAALAAAALVGAVVGVNEAGPLRDAARRVRDAADRAASADWARRAAAFPPGDLALVRSVIASRPDAAEHPDTTEVGPMYGAAVLYRADFERDPMAACALKRAFPGVLTMTDQEGGTVVRLHADGAVPTPPSEAAAMGADAYRGEASAVAARLRAHCVDVNLAPVVEPANDGDRTRWRSASEDIDEVARFASAFADGMLAGGVAPTFKHFPGRTRTISYSRSAADLVGAGTEVRTVRDDAPARGGLTVRGVAERFRAARFPALVMLSNDVYPDIAPGHAAREPVFARWLRDEIGFDGLVVTDNLEEAVLDPALVEDAFRNADMLMVTSSSVHMAEVTLMEALRDGRISRADIEERRARADRLRAWLAAPGAP